MTTLPVIDPRRIRGSVLRAGVAFASLLELTAIFVLASPPAQAGGSLEASASSVLQDERVTKFCLATVSAAFQAARKVAPPGLEAFACTCFIDQVSQGVGLDVAQSTCRQKASARYNL